MKRVIFMLLVVATVWKILSDPGAVTLGPGVYAKESPRQEGLATPTSFNHGDYTITPMARFWIKAKVLSREEYTFDREADLSPVDLALGWGNMSDESVIEQIDISQSGRWYRWQTRNPPIPVREIETHSANMHLIPANDTVESKIEKVRTGDIIELTGKLVAIKASDGWRWKSSMTRKDTGASACEVIWVEQFEVGYAESKE
ncbi:MAG: hypothetical protein GY814_04670 [Gammaproteobacteria bacterium]|nr:hypothetical protein [Gammaproteobacteria bacterium]